MGMMKGGDKTRAVRKKNAESVANTKKRRSSVVRDAIANAGTPTICTGDGRRLVCAEGLVVKRLQPAPWPFSDDVPILSFHAQVHGQEWK